MQKALLFFSFWFIASCTPKPNTIKVISSYQYGLETTKSIDLIGNLIPIGKFCLENNVESNEEQLLIPRARYKYIHYKYELNEVISWLNTLNKCDNNSSIIYLNNVSSNSWNYQRQRVNGYNTYITLNTSYLCDQKIKTYSSQAEQGLTKYALLYGEKKNQAIMSATVILAFHAAVLDIYNQIKSQCETTIN